MKIRREVLIGIVIVAAIGLLYVGLNYLKGVYVFQKPMEYYAVYDQINGLQPTNPVMVNGYKIGQVKDIEMLPNGGNDSVLQVIEAILNTESQENLVQSFRGINASIQNLERATFRIDTLVGEERVRIRAIFKNIEEVSTVLKDNSDEFANVIQNFSTISDTLAQADIAGTITKANKALTEVDQIVEKINKGEGSLGMLINNPGLYNRLDSAAKNLDYLVEDIRVNPNRYIHFSVFGRKNKSVDLTKKELEQLKDYVKSSEEENE
ncbi:MAG: MlaD family protein [Flavobacteriales bacterium]|nr:MlaD family protein [Flavobacteriales bacterium]